MTSVVLEAEGLHTYYGKSHILRGVSLEVREGEIVSLLGRNGAGKSTTMRSLMGLTKAREGTVRIFGHTTTQLNPYRIAALGVGFVPEGRKIFPNLTVEENLKVPAERPGPRATRRATSGGRPIRGHPPLPPRGSICTRIRRSAALRPRARAT